MQPSHILLIAAVFLQSHFVQVNGFSKIVLNEILVHLRTVLTEADISLRIFDTLLVSMLHSIFSDVLLGLLFLLFLGFFALLELLLVFFLLLEGPNNRVFKAT